MSLRWKAELSCDGCGCPAPVYARRDGVKYVVIEAIPKGWKSVGFWISRNLCPDCLEREGKK